MILDDGKLTWLHIAHWGGVQHCTSTTTEEQLLQQLCQCVRVIIHVQSVAVNYARLQLCIIVPLLLAEYEVTKAPQLPKNYACYWGLLTFIYYGLMTKCLLERGSLWQFIFSFWEIATMVIFPNNYFWLGKNHQQFVLDPEVLLSGIPRLRQGAFWGRIQILDSILWNHIWWVWMPFSQKSWVEVHPVGGRSQFSIFAQF